jgi:hypothetical protein
LPESVHIAVTALLDAPDLSEHATLLAQQLGLTPRQSDLAAHLLDDKSVAGAARAMGISRPPRVTIVVASLEPRTLGAAMKEISGTLRTIIQGPGSSSAVAA